MMKNPAQIQLDMTPDSARYDDGPLESGANTHCVAIPDAWPARAVHRRIELNKVPGIKKKYQDHSQQELDQ